MNLMGKKKKIKVSDSLEDLFGVEEKADILPNNENPQGIGKNGVSSSDQSKNSHFLTIPELSSNSIIECPPKIDAVFITRKAFEDIVMMARAVNELSKERWGINSQKLEVFCYVLTDESAIMENSPAIITEIYIPHHTATETAVTVSTDAVLEVSDYIKEKKKVLLGWAHSHGHFEVYSSKTDEQNHRTLLNDTSNYLTKSNFRIKYVYGITIVEGGDHLGVILTQYPCGHIGRAIDSSFEIQGDAYSDHGKEHRFYQIKDIIEDRVDIIKPSVQSSRNDSLQDISEEFVSEYISNLRKAKNLLYDKLPEDMDEHFELFQRVLHEYDTLLMSTAEETFTNVSEKLLSAMKQYKDNV